MFCACVQNDRLICYNLFCEEENGCNMIRGDQSMNMGKSRRASTSRLARVGAVRVPGWDPSTPVTRR